MRAPVYLESTQGVAISNDALHVSIFHIRNGLPIDHFALLFVDTDVARRQGRAEKQTIRVYGVEWTRNIHQIPG